MDKTFVLVALVPHGILLVAFPLLCLVSVTEINLGETILRLPCLEIGSGTRRSNMLSMTAGRAPGEVILSPPPPPTRVGFDMGGSLVAQSWYPIRLAGLWVLGVSVSSFLEAVVVILRPAFLLSLDLRS